MAKCMFCAFMFKIDMKAQKTCKFSCISHLESPFTPPLHHNDRGSIVSLYCVFEVPLEQG